MAYLLYLFTSTCVSLHHLTIIPPAPRAASVCSTVQEMTLAGLAGNRHRHRCGIHGALCARQFNVGTNSLDLQHRQSTATHNYVHVDSLHRNSGVSLEAAAMSTTEVTQGEAELERMLQEAERLAARMRHAADQETSGSLASGTYKGSAGEDVMVAPANDIDKAVLAAQEMEKALKDLNTPVSLSSPATPARTPVPSSPRAWDKLAEPRLGDADYVPIRDYSDANKPPVVDSNNVKWEKMDFVEANDDDYVPLADYSNLSPARSVGSNKTTVMSNPRRRRRRKKMVRVLAFLLIVAAVVFLVVRRTSAPAPRVAPIPAPLPLEPSPFEIPEPTLVEFCAAITQPREIEVVEKKRVPNCNLPLAWLTNPHCHESSRVERFESILQSMLQ